MFQFLHSNIAVSLSQQDTIRDLEGKLNDANQEILRLQKEIDRFKLMNRGAFTYSKGEK